MFINELEAFFHRHDLKQTTLQKIGEAFIKSDLMTKYEVVSLDTINIELVSKSIAIKRDFVQDAEYQLRYSIVDKEYFPIASCICTYTQNGTFKELMLKE